MTKQVPLVYPVSSGDGLDGIGGAAASPHCQNGDRRPFLTLSILFPIVALSNGQNSAPVMTLIKSSAKQ